MELRHLRYFVAVAEELNFSKAARRLHVSQPPLSRQIKDLESELGVSLFERVKNPVRLTEAGQLLYVEARRLLQQADELMAQARRLAQSQKQELRVGYIANVHGRLVIDSATRFRKAHPEVTVRVFDCTTAEQVTAIVTGRIDLGFVGFREAPVQGGLQIERIGTTYGIMALARGHRLALRKAQPLAAFKDEPFVAISEHAFPGARQYVLQFCREAGFQPRIVHEALQPIDLLNLVALGEGIALVPQRMRYLPHPGVVFCDLREPVLRADSYVAWKVGNKSELLQDLVRTAKETYASLMRQHAHGHGG